MSRASIVIVTVVLSVALFSESQGQPHSERAQNPPQSQAQNRPEQLEITIPSPTKNKEEAAEEKAERKDISDANWWMVRLTAIIGLIGLLQLAVFGVQAFMLKETIGKMDEIAEGQTEDMKSSIDQATRAATAMEGVATSMSKNVESLKDTIAINRRIADRQKLVSEMQLRAYISVVIGAAVYQERGKKIRFEGRPLLVNQGGTPARKVIHVTNVGIFPVPLPKGFEFPNLGKEPAGESMIGPQQNRTLSAILDDYVADDSVEKIKRADGRGLYVWGHINYVDAFDEPRETTFCQLLTWLPNGQVLGYFIPNRNNAT
jgi:hypothetical protein